ncbi:hypothetical protein H5410_007304 [Solanum commersonii]|uniref:Telomeric single stranded DNA binding POT1/Cdc13 domain-containing protein n=1 Tax=Solanum commersonii TaxID=4109 RepID=A0A9J6ABL2_SOLCO|nr:hypothetical protein H5410_007304 [Solanum commersonii]
MNISSSRDDYKFLQIVDARAALGQKVNLIGVVIETGLPKQSKGTDYCQACQNNQLTFSFESGYQRVGNAALKVRRLGSLHDPSEWPSGLSLGLPCWRSQVRNPLPAKARGLLSRSSSSH